MLLQNGEMKEARITQLLRSDRMYYSFGEIATAHRILFITYVRTEILRIRWVASKIALPYKKN